MVTFTDLGLHLKILRDFPFEAEIQTKDDKAVIAYSGLSFGGNETMSFTLKMTDQVPMHVSLRGSTLYVDAQIDYSESNLLNRYFCKQILEMIKAW